MSSTLTEYKPRYEGWSVTREEYLDLEEDGYKYDVIQGVMYLTPSASSDHGHAQGRFIIILGNYLEANPTGKAFLEVDVFLPDGGDPLRPDISFVAKDRVNIIKTHIHGAPDLVCEVLSERTAARDLGEKSERYLRTGVKEYWIVDPRSKSVQLWINRKERWEKHTENPLKSEYLSGFGFEVERMFL